MDETSPLLLKKVATVNGGVFASYRRTQSMGWPALVSSIAIHIAAIAFAAWLSLDAQGDDGSEDMAGGDAEPQAIQPMQLLVPKPHTEPVLIKSYPIKALHTANLSRLLARTQDAALLLPEWEMPVSALLQAPPTAVAATPSQPAHETVEAIAKTSPTPKAQHRAVGKGAGSGSGGGKVGAQTPQLLSSTTPRYPAKARRANVQGCATVKVTVGNTGRVIDCTIYHSTGSADLDTAALQAVKDWRFTPAATDSAMVLVRVNFKLA
jgi:TonB family protein